MRSRSTARRSSGSGAAVAWSTSPAPSSSTANGCVARTGASTRASSCEPPTTASTGSAPRAFAERARRELLATGETAPQAHRGDPRRPHAPGGADRPDGERQADEPGDRRQAVHQPAHRRVPPAQGVHQARHQLAQGAARRAGRDSRPRRCHRASARARPGTLGGCVPATKVLSRRRRCPVLAAARPIDAHGATRITQPKGPPHAAHDRPRPRRVRRVGELGRRHRSPA